MDPPPTAEGSQVLSDIEQSIKNALALFNSKDLKELDGLYVIDDPIVSLHDPKKRDEIPNSCKPDTTQNKLSPKTEAEIEGNQQFYDALPFTNIKMSQESVVLPFLENPIQHTIDEMQRVLNKKTDIFSPKLQSKPSQHKPKSPPYEKLSSPQLGPHTPTEDGLQPGPSPEEILNLYSQDLGITLSPNVSPRGDFERSYNESEFSKTKQNKKEKKNIKKPKQPKSNKEKKTDTKKGKPGKSEMKNQDMRMRELMNIYGCGDKMKKLKSDSTLGSKSGVSRNVSMKKLTSVNNISSKASSVAVSRKSKKLKYKFTNDLDINLSEADLAPIEKSSRLSTKRKVKPKNNNLKPIKKPNLKRKLVGKPSNDDVELKLSKSFQNSTRNRNYEINKVKNYAKDFDDSHKNPRKPTIPKPINRKQKDSNNNNNRKALGINNKEGFSKSGLTVLDAIPNIKECSIKNNSSFPDLESNKLNNFLNKQSQIIDMEKDQNILSKKVSEERRQNKQVSVKDSVHYHSYKTENKETISDFGNEGVLEEPTQFHYTLPTQSSRSKEVERFLNGHYQHLPFVIGQSVNKSHNLWVNIQEALSLIKHNLPQTIEIQSTHEKDSDRPLSVLSKLTTKSSKKIHQCPALMNDGLYDIPETSAEMEDGVKAWEDHPDCIQANLDPNFSRPRCSCQPQATLSYKKVLRQIFGGGEDLVDLNRARDEVVEQGGDNYTTELRKVLITFTQEFEDLNNKYEALLADPNASKEELQRLEMYLETKEEEIREVIARINEVKELNDRVRGEMPVRGSSLEPYKSTTSVQLWQTLRRVQQFKEDIMSKPSGRHTSRISCAKSSY